MAAFTSAQNGNWNDGATWGNTSPGTKGVDWPGAAGDTATIGHTVTYNVSETNEMGAITINSGGILTFSTTASTKLTLGHVDITVNSGGELRAGASGAVIPAAYAAEILWNTTANDAKGLYINDGGVLSIYGDPAYYGSEYRAKLASAWTTGQTFTIVGDFTTKWNVGDEVTLHTYGIQSSYLTDNKIFTIASIAANGGNTDITINEAAPGITFNAGAPVRLVTRNVRLGKLSASTGIGNTNSNRPRIYDNNAKGNSNCVVSNAQLTGFNGIRSVWDFQFLDSVYRNGNCLITQGYSNANRWTISGLVYSCSTAMNWGFDCTISADFYAHNTAFYNPTLNSISGHLYGNAYVINSGERCVISGLIYSNGIASTGSRGRNNIYTSECCIYQNYTAFQISSGNHISASIGWDADDNSKPNNYDFAYSNSNTFEVLRGAKVPSGGLVLSDRNYTGGGNFTVVHSEDHNRVAGAYVRYERYGTVEKDTGVTRTGGADNSIKATPLSLCDASHVVPLFEWTELDVPASAQERTVYIKGAGWTTFPTATELYVEVEYVSATSPYTRSFIKTTAVLTDNTNWVAFTLNFTPATETVVRYRAFLKTYEAGAAVYVDNKLYGAGPDSEWMDGNSILYGGGGGGVSRARIVNGGM